MEVPTSFEGWAETASAELPTPDPDHAGGGNGLLDRVQTMTADDCAEALTRFRERRPHVHCITNAVAQNVTANVLLAAGATPSTTIAPAEIADFVGFSDALLVNLGTMDEERREAAEIAVGVAVASGKPWVLDPVFVQASSTRRALANRLAARRPTLVRANEAERAVLTLGDDQLVAVTGPNDRVVQGARTATLSNGTPVMARVTAMGCALTALVAGFIAAHDDPFAATAAALAFFAVAGEVAAERSHGPGTFQPALLDALAATTPERLRDGVRFA